ncbi:creatininase family protein [Kribbella sp. NPDC050459]|uniref:creatininase family protein n=1 Tax=Kribbella sp. NPDC050459 TaxID=3155785 RepID=UPI0034011EC8
MLNFEELTRDELSELAPRALVVVPVGSIEQHGPHLPVGVDCVIVSELARRAAAEAGRTMPVLVTPTLPFGFAQHHVPFGGTVSINVATYQEVLTDIGKSLVASGFRRLFFLNGHGGNDPSVQAVGDRLVFELGLDVHVAAASYWTCAADILAGLDLGIGPVPGHAGAFETSCMLAIAPDQVRTEVLPIADGILQPLAATAMGEAVVRRPGVWSASDGRTDDASGASAALGEKALTAIAERVARFVIDFHQST